MITGVVSLLYHTWVFGANCNPNVQQTANIEVACFGVDGMKAQVIVVLNPRDRTHTHAHTHTHTYIHIHIHTYLLNHGHTWLHTPHRYQIFKTIRRRRISLSQAFLWASSRRVRSHSRLVASTLRTPSCHTQRWRRTHREGVCASD